MRSRGEGLAGDAWQDTRHPLLAGYMDMVRLFCALCKDHHALDFQHGDGDHWTDWTSIYRRVSSATVHRPAFICYPAVFNTSPARFRSFV